MGVNETQILFSVARGAKSLEELTLNLLDKGPHILRTLRAMKRRGIVKTPNKREWELVR